MSAAPNRTLASVITDALIAFHLSEKIGDRDGAGDFLRVVTQARHKTVSKITRRRLQLAEDMTRVYGSSYVLRLQQEIDTLHEAELNDETSADRNDGEG